GDAQDIGGHGGDLDAAIAASRQRAETKSTQELQLELEAARLRLVRRSQIIDALRKAYMRDVIIIKNELARKADISEEEYIASGGPGTDITDAIPSLDMRPVLALFSPEDAFLRFESCAGCGGHLEIVTKETKRVARLTKRISGLVAQAEESKKVTAQLRAELTLTRQKVNELDERIVVNRDTLVAQLERTRHQCDDTISTLREDTRRAERAWQLRISQKDVELAAIPVLKARVNAQDQELKEEVSGREQDNHLRDGEIATLKAKVEDLENSGQETNKLLLRERSTCEEIRRRLKGEKDDHAATNGLLEEERARYERCRASLEIAQEHLADLNDRYNELRSEVEANAENAEEQAGEASDALASAKQEAKRLRAVLGQNDLAVALEQSNLKVSSLSEELHAARSESREAADALRECQTLNETLKAELDRQKLYPSKSAGGSSMSSAGGLSWHESIASGLGEYVDEDPEERRDRMSSAMLPGSRRFEKGKWAVEKWIGLVRSRKEVEKHNSEVAHLKHLLKLKQANLRQGRSPFVSRDEALSANHERYQYSPPHTREVCSMSVKSRCSSITEEHPVGDARRRIRNSGGTATSFPIKLLEKREHDFEARLAEAQVVHEQALEALQLELEKCKEDLAALGAEADEMRSKLKQVEKLEKTKKGHSAMTAELKKMKAEIVVDVEVESSMETPSFEGDMGKEEETRLLEDLSNAKDEIKNMKIRQAMVTHELLGTVKGCHGEIEVLRDKLSKMTAERDARVDISTLAATAGKLSGADTEEFVSLKAECKARKKEISRLEQEMQEGSDALKTVLETISKGCMETRRAKLKVWNERDLDRARSIPPLP
ncbi:unnamed protein product, partial [Sphacelaria rigidula]